MDLETGKELKSPLESAGAVRHIATTNSGDSGVVVNADASVRMWRLASEGAITVRKPQRARFIAMSTHGRAMAVRRDLGRGLEVRFGTERRPKPTAPGGRRSTLPSPLASILGRVPRVARRAPAPVTLPRRRVERGAGAGRDRGGGRRARTHAG